MHPLICEATRRDFIITTSREELRRFLSQERQLVLCNYLDVKLYNDNKMKY